MKGESSHQTGDINLAAALMACEISLTKECPVRLIESVNSKPYAAFSLAQYSTDGFNITESLMEYWSTSKGIPMDHPFALICSFIKGRPPGKLSTSDWMDYAIDYLNASGVQLPGIRMVSDISMFVERFPRLPESYILAFVANRSVCLDLYHKARRSVYMSREQSHALIDSALPAWQRNEILSRLQG